MPLEPELTGPAPRPVRRRPGHGHLITFTHVFILPHTLVGLLGICALAYGLCFAVFADFVDGTVRSTTWQPGKKGGGSWSTVVSLEHDGARKETSLSLPDQPRLGSTVALRAWGPTVMGADTLPFTLVVGLFFVAFWNAVLLAFHFPLTITPLRQKALVREGNVTRGSTLEVKELSGRKTRYELSYGYSVEGRDFVGRMLIRKADRGVTPLTGVTVLYAPDEPSRSIAYPFAPYVAVD